MSIRRAARGAVVAALGAATLAAPAAATPVCTDGYMGGPPAAACGMRIFPEAALARAYVQYTSDPTGFNEYQHGIEHLARKYSRWVSVTSLSKLYGKDAVSAGTDGKRPGEPGDAGDGRDIQIIKITDHAAPDAGKRVLLHSLAVHGNERGGLEGGLRTAEDLAVSATSGGKIDDGIANYESSTGRDPQFHSIEVREALAKEVVYLVDLNPDGWAAGDLYAPVPSPYARGNGIGTDLNRQMPTIGRIDSSRTPLQEPEARYGKRFFDDIAAAGRGGRLDYGSDVHGELTSRAYVDIMYPAGQFDSVDHRRLMAIAERTKSVLDETLYAGIIDQAESAQGGNDSGEEQNAVPLKPAHWATVWDTLGYTDTGFIGDYLATEVGVTGMDYEIAFNHTVPDKAWNVYLQDNHINATRGIIKTSMAYAFFQEQEFNDDNVVVDAKGRPGYVVNPKRVTSADGSGGRPGAGGKGSDGKQIVQAPYDVTNQQWFADTSRLMPKPFVPLAAADVAAGAATLDLVDSLVLADIALPEDAKGRPVDRATYFASLRSWVERGGNLVLTDRALHALADLKVVGKGSIQDVSVYQPYANFSDFTHPLARGLRPNARQLVEAALLGYEIGEDASPMTVVSTADWQSAGGVVVATTGNNTGNEDAGTQTSIGEVKVGKGVVRIVGGALPTPTEKYDHRFGLRDYGLTPAGLFVMENAVTWDVPDLGIGDLPRETPPTPAVACVPRRSLRVRVPSRMRGKRVRSVTFKVPGKRARKARRRGKHFVATLDLRGLREGRVKVTITQRVAGKRSAVRSSRQYRTCLR